MLMKGKRGGELYSLACLVLLVLPFLPSGHLRDPTVTKHARTAQLLASVLCSVSRCLTFSENYALKLFHWWTQTLTGGPG